MSQLERRLTEQLAKRLEENRKIRHELNEANLERKKITEMYLEANQACIDAEAQAREMEAERNRWMGRAMELVDQAHTDEGASYMRAIWYQEEKEKKA